MDRTPSQLADISQRRKVREGRENKLAERNRNVAVLVYDYLRLNGHNSAADDFTSSCTIPVSNYGVCDNLDISVLLQQYEEYHEYKFGKPPTITKMKKQEPPKQSLPPISSLRQGAKPRRLSVQSAKSPADNEGRQDLSSGSDAGDFEVCGSEINISNSNHPKKGDKKPDLTWEDVRQIPTLPSSLRDDPELGSLYSSIYNDIISRNPGTSWDDIIGCLGAKRILRESVIAPRLYPELFTGLLSPWRGILLYGPAGTGKTMLAKALAADPHCRTTFFNISASTIVSRWHGQSEKLVRCLFTLARLFAPSTIFIDELDSIIAQRDCDGIEHEASRRLKTEFLLQMDGLSSTDQHVLVLCASNLPWLLDVAMLRRLEKRIYVEPPDVESRKFMIRKFLGDRLILKGEKVPISRQGCTPVSQSCLSQILAGTDGFSGSDIHTLCKEAAMAPVRKFLSSLDDDLKPKMRQGQIESALCVTEEDLSNALKNTKPAAAHWNTKKYDEFQSQCGSE